ncbi:MAG: hypothetical protein RLZZ174_1426, partial [Pseudomonadota bacterium]
MLRADAYRARLEAGFEGLALPLEGQAVDRLLGWLALHERWSRAFNLTGAQAPEVLIDGHLLD